MKVQKYQSDEERSILTALIVNSRVLGKVVSGLKQEAKPFRSKWSNQIYVWCRDFYNEYGKAPRENIRLLFSGFADKHGDSPEVDLIEKYLGSLSDDYKALAKELNADYLVDSASRYFSEIRYTRLKDSLEESLLRKDLDTVKEKMAQFNPVSFDARAGVSVFTNFEAWREALTINEDQSLVLYPGDIGEFFGQHLCRDGFIAFLAPEKRGKSFWLIDVAWRAAAKSKRRTMFFSVGDMSKNQMMRRFIARAARRPLEAGDVSRPVKIQLGSDGKIKVKRRSSSYDSRLSENEAKLAQETILKLTASNSSLLELECSSNSTTTVADIRVSMDAKIHEGWYPDVVVVDYADILAPEAGLKGQDFRHQTNETWKALRRLSQDYHCLVLTATQSDAASYDGVLLRRSNFSEDKRKLSHVTGMVGLNQTEKEKQLGIFRLNWILLREGVYYETKCVTVAGSLALVNPAMISTW